MIRILFFSIAILFSICTNVQAITVVMEEVKSDGTRYWNGDNIEFPCTWKGKTCKITRYPVVDNSSLDINKLTNGGYTLNGKFTWIGFETYGLSPAQTTNATLNGFTFLEDEYRIKITDGGDYPELNGISIDMDGTVLNSSGEFQIYIPPVQ